MERRCRLTQHFQISNYEKSLGQMTAESLTSCSAGTPFLVKILNFLYTLKMFNSAVIF